jgi:hypothetical protein
MQRLFRLFQVILLAVEFNTNPKRKRGMRDPLPRLRFGLVSAAGKNVPFLTASVIFAGDTSRIVSGMIAKLQAAGVVRGDRGGVNWRQNFHISIMA